jgi:hypothetical protein
LKITAGVLLLFLAYNLGLNRLLDKYESLNKEIGLSALKLKKYLRLLSQKENIRAQAGSFSGWPGLSAENKDHLVGVMSGLEALAKGAGLRIIDIRPQNPRQGRTRQEILIELRTEGNMEGYLKFAYDLENSLLFLQIKKMQLSAKPNSSFLEGLFSVCRLSAP